MYGVVLCLAYRAILPKIVVPGSANEVVSKRRLLLSRAGVAVLSVGGLAGTAGLVRTYLDEYSSYDGMQTFPQNQITPAITTNADHYVVTQNASDPTTNIDLWRLEVTGLVKNPGTYTFSEVQQLAIDLTGHYLAMYRQWHRWSPHQHSDLARRDVALAT